MNDTVQLRCPWCFQALELFVDPETRGEMVQDCDVCCRPMALRVDRDPDGEPQVTATRAQ